MIGLRLAPDSTAKIDAWAEEIGASRSEAIRRLTDIALLGLPVVLEELLRLEAQTDDLEALSTAAKLRDILNRK